MCGTHLCPDLPQTTVTYAVSYCHQSQRWHGLVCSHTTLSDGETIHHGSLTREFGPFDGSLDVAQWMSREMHSQTKLQALRDNLELPGPPQG